MLSVGLLISFGAFSAKAAALDVSSADVVGGTTIWRGVQNSAGTGFLTDSGGRNGDTTGILDQQTGQNVSDLVGTASAPTLYIGYGTIGGVDHIGFRMRLNEFSTVGAIKQVSYVGFDFDNNGAADMFVGVDLKSQQSSNWSVIIADTDNSGANTSPSTTTITYGTQTAPLYSLSTNGNDSYANYQQVTAANSTVGGNTTTSGNADAFLTFALPYSAFVAAITNASVMGSSFNFDANTTYRITAGTSQQENNINQDAMAGMTVAFNFSSPINTSGNPIPEASTAAMLAALLVPALFITSRRRGAKARTQDKQS